jgi:probable addiction module antidote protein
LLGDGDGELRIDYGPGYRVYYKQFESVVVVRLTGGDKRTRQRDIEYSQSLARNLERTKAMARTKARRRDATEHLKTERDMVAYLEAALEDDDPALFTAALGDIARAKGMTEIARKAGLGRESLYKALSRDGNPEFATILKVVHSLGLRLRAKTA